MQMQCRLETRRFAHLELQCGSSFYHARSQLITIVERGARPWSPTVEAECKHERDK
jgi:hypothetical protein